MSFLSDLFSSGPAIDFKEMLHKGALIIDVRSAEEFRSGHIPQSQNIPLPILGQKLASIKKLKKPVIAVCQSGGRSGMAVSMLKQQGIEVVNGGGWHSLQTKLR